MSSRTATQTELSWYIYILHITYYTIVTFTKSGKLVYIVKPRLSFMFTIHSVVVRPVAFHGDAPSSSPTCGFFCSSLRSPAPWNHCSPFLLSISRCTSICDSSDRNGTQIPFSFFILFSPSGITLKLPRQIPSLLLKGHSPLLTAHGTRANVLVCPVSFCFA